MMAITKVWVRRPNSSPTRIQIPSSVSTPNVSLSSSVGRDTPQPIDFDVTEDFLVDDLREVILKRYPQSLGKHHDSADLTIRIHDNGEPDKGRVLAPDESVIKILMEEYPHGQKSSEAWTIITSGGRDNYTRWWLQTGGFSNDLYPVRGTFSPNQLIQSTGGSYGSEAVYSQQQEYFPYTPLQGSALTPPGELPTRPRGNGVIMPINQHSRTQQRPPLRPNRSTIQEGIGIFPGRRYENTVTSSMVVETVSGAESEVPHARRISPDSTVSSQSQRYPPGRNTPPGEYTNRPRGYSKGSASAPTQPFHMQLPPQQVPSSTPKVSSPLGGPPILPPQRPSQGNVARPTNTIVPNATPTVSPENPAQQTSSPKSPESANSSSRNGGLAPTSSSANAPGGTTSPTVRRRSNTLTGAAPAIPKAHSSPIAERTAEVPVVKPKPEKTTVLGVIPPINVLIVEDNMINAQILEAFFRKRKLKYATAVNGKEAVEKWRQGGWHLVLMDIQLPVMSGIEATKEIRRLERVNHIGVFSEETPDKPSPEDELGDLLFPSPVIIVALTASSRESDRNEALAAGCNDFLTKPVGAPWLERKAIEWGCMQALIWTSFARKKRRKVTFEDQEIQSVEADIAGENAQEQVTERPPVSRDDSGESIMSKESGGTDEGQQA